jgi:hypothetical protein
LAALRSHREDEKGRAGGGRKISLHRFSALCKQPNAGMLRFAVAAAGAKRAGDGRPLTLLDPEFPLLLDSAAHIDARPIGDDANHRVAGL